MKIVIMLFVVFLIIGASEFLPKIIGADGDWIALYVSAGLIAYLSGELYEVKRKMNQ
ncbi:hypothetical protein [Bacillus sp. FSL K6-6540]|uniref:hypothetical protein n=1 Tax=Bacillus sp. FSL K6-6540 TaxID=2921512 RepID=UPI0030FA7DAD